MLLTLLADSGATKTEWTLLEDSGETTFFTQGISPYFLSQPDIVSVLTNELPSRLRVRKINRVQYFGSGCARAENAALVAGALAKVFEDATISVESDLMGAAKSVCGNKPGVVAILGTGSNSCYFDGSTIVRNSPGLGFILGDEGSGAFLGKKVIQHYLYDTFDEDLRARFDARFVTTSAEIIDAVYRKPFPNRYLAEFALFLAENRGHYMIENILEDGLNEFFFEHLNKYAEVWTHPVSFVGSVAWGFRDVLQSLCKSYEFELGIILKNPMTGLIEHYKRDSGLANQN